MIRFGLPHEVHVRLSIYNVLGQKVADLVDDTRPAGFYTVEFDANRCASGIFFYSMEAGNFTAVRKMLILK